MLHSKKGPAHDQTTEHELKPFKVDNHHIFIEMIKNNVRVNLTEMAKDFGKLPSQWIRLKSTKNYIKTIAMCIKCTSGDLVEVRKGGDFGNQGTWANNRLIAIRFAQWLDPVFAVKVDLLLEKLITGELELKKPRLKLYDHEKPLFPHLKKWLVLGDITDVAKELGLSRGHVSHVKCGDRRSWPVMQALLKRCRYNRDTGRSNGYPRKSVQLELGLFDRPKALA